MEHKGLNNRNPGLNNEENSPDKNLDDLMAISAELEDIYQANSFDLQDAEEIDNASINREIVTNPRFQENVCSPDTADRQCSLKGNKYSQTDPVVQNNYTETDVANDILFIRQGINNILTRLDNIEAVKPLQPTGVKLIPDNVSVAEQKSDSEETENITAGKAESLQDESDEIPFIDENEIPILDVIEDKKPGAQESMLSTFPVPSGTVKAEVDNMLANMKNSSFEKDAGQLEKLLGSTSCLDFLKPRYFEIMKRGETNHQVLTGLYRIVSRCLNEELANKERELKEAAENHEQYKKKMAMLNEALKYKTEKLAAVDADMNTKLNKEKIEILQKEVHVKVDEIEKINVRFERLQNDFNNFRNRQKKDIDRLVGQSKEEMLLDILKVLDNLDRALEISKNSQNQDAVVDGFKKIQEQFIDILKNHNLKEIPAQGVQFDPFYHEALAREVSNDHQEGMIIEVLNKGYMINEKVIRPSQVKIIVSPEN
jgi:molecular chaperone GrpE